MQRTDCFRDRNFPTTVDVDLRNRETVLVRQFTQVPLLVFKPPAVSDLALIIRAAADESPAHDGMSPQRISDNFRTGSFGC